MMRMRKHVNRAYPGHPVRFFHHIQVARLGCGVATYVNNCWRLHFKDFLNKMFAHPRAWWIRYNNIRAAMLSKKSVVTHFRHIANSEVTLGQRRVT